MTFANLQQKCVNGVKRNLTNEKYIPILSKRVLHIVWALYYIHIVVEVTMNMAEYTSSWQSAAGAAKECQYLNQL